MDQGIQEGDEYAQQTADGSNDQTVCGSLFTDVYGLLADQKAADGPETILKIR